MILSILGLWLENVFINAPEMYCRLAVCNQIRKDLQSIYERPLP